MKATRFFTPLPVVFRSAAILLLVALPATSVPVPVYAAADPAPDGPPPLTDATAPTPVTTPKNVKVKTGSRDFKRIEPKLKFSNAPTDADITTARVFEEPLIPTQGEPNAAEDAALAQALTAFQSRQSVEDVGALTDFLAHYPDSRWKASLQLNIGLIQYQTGYFSRALASWSSAWNLAKDEADPMPKAVADQAIGEFLLLNARLGRVEVLRQYFPELSDRQFQGPAQEKISAASEGLWRMEHHPEIAFKCGPYAVNSILNIGKTVKGRDPIIEAARSTAMGTSLGQVKEWADAVKLDYQMAKRTPGSSWIVPAVVHWNVGHFGAIVDQKDGRYLIQDPTFGGGELWVSAQALEAESSGYFLVPSGALPEGWQPVTDQEEAGTVWGRGGAGDRSNGDTGNGPQCGCGMARVSIFSALATLHLADTPIWYRPPVGPEMDFTVGYTQLEANQPGNFTFSNFGSGWTFNWLSYLTVDASQNVSVALRGGGTEVYPYSLLNNVDNTYAANVLSQAVIVLVSKGVYERRLPDGSKEVFNQPDGTGRIFLTQVVDPQGNSAVLHYDANFRIDYILDAINQQTTITYKSNTVGNAGFYKIYKITDPFGRYAQFDYDSTQTQLIKITDEIGLASQFNYNTSTGSDTYAGGGIDTLTTPYGKTLFYNYHPNGDLSLRGLKVVFPDGSQEVLENWIGEILTTYFWDQKAMQLYPGDQTKARITRWCLNTNGNIQSSVPQYTKNPLEAEVDYAYANQDDIQHHHMGSSNQPTSIDRILDNGATHQTWQYQYNDFGRVTQSVDPAGRTFTSSYAANGVDLMEVRQTKGGNNDLIGKWYYNSQHRPIYHIDGSGRATSYGYNARGQLTSVVDAKFNTTTLTYDSNGYLTQIDGPLAGNNDVTTFSYDGYGRLRTVTDSEGYALTYDYDALNRPTKVTYPDGTYEQTTWDRLDPILSRDRLGQWTQRNYNSVRQLVSETDPAGRTTAYSWCSCGSLESITDAAGHTTTWMRDLEGRPTQKIFADSTFTSYVYENTTSRLKNTTDALGQVTNYVYNVDNTLSQVSYSNAAHATSSVNYTYDANYPRIATVQNGWGTLTYTFNPYVTDPYGTAVTGGGMLQKVANNVMANSDTTYTYDELGRQVTRSIDGANNTVATAYDAMGRVTGVTNPLSSGTFVYNYVDSAKGTRRLSSVNYPNGQVTNYSYYNNAGDQRLQEIQNLNPDASALSKQDYVYDAIGRITQWTQQNDSSAALQYALGYDHANQLSSAVLSGTSVVKQYYYGYDAAGNRTSEQINTGVNTASYNNVNGLTGASAGGAVRFQGALNEPGTVTVNGTPAKMTSGTSFAANPVLGTGTNTVTVAATDGSGNTRTNQYQVVVDSGAGRTLAYDSEGNMTDNGNGQTYEWDGANRLLAINYASGTIRRTEFTYDGLGQREKIVEKNGPTVLSTKQFVFCPGETQPSEERDGSNAVVTRYYFQGEKEVAGVLRSAGSYFYTRDHLGSIREVVYQGGDTSRYSYDPWGRRSWILLSPPACTTMGYAGYYYHEQSGLYLTLNRAYSPDFGRWISRDPIAEAGGINLYGYVGNNPISYVDPLGLRINWAGVFNSTKSMIDTMRKQDPDFNRQVAQLDASPNTWNITTHPYDVTQMNVKPANEANECNGKGTGGTINIVPPGGSIKTPDGTFSAQEIAAHEFQHAVDMDKGTLNTVGKQLDNGWMIPNWGAEVRAVDAQNRYDRAIGSSNSRTNYGGIPVH